MPRPSPTRAPARRRSWPASTLATLGLILAASGCGDDPSAVPAAPARELPLADECLEPEPPPPGPCTIQVVMEGVYVDKGQGVTEGDLELNVQGSTNGGAAVGYPSATGTRTIEKETGKSIGALVSEHSLVPPNTQIIEVCAEVRETDNGGFNGKDDIAAGCRSIKIGCNMPPRLVTITEPLCKGGTTPCNANGEVTTTFRISHSDEDGDGVENLEDFAPKSCSDDASVLGQAGRGVLVFYHIQDESYRDLARLSTVEFTSAVNLDEAIQGYDYVALLVEDPFPHTEDFTGYNYIVSEDAIIGADYNGEPTVDGFFAALRDVVSKGFDVDIFIVGEGEQYQAASGLDARFLAQDGTISGLDVFTRLRPAQSGSRTIPIRLVYSVASYTDLLVPRWLTAGAKAATGPRQFNFFPANQGSVSYKWNNGATADAATAGISTIIDWESIFTMAYEAIYGLDAVSDEYHPNGCPDGEDSIDDCYYCEEGDSLAQDPALNACEWDVFLQGEPFPILAYDPALDPVENMFESSYQVRGGNPAIKKWTTPVTW
jgi:hypothetical protein